MMNQTRYIFVDYENVHEVDLGLIANKPVVTIIIIGERHKNLPLEMVRQILKYPSQVRLIEAGRSGRNALDFVLSYQLGIETGKDANGSFHIVSRDTGFDPLVEYLKKNHIKAQRDETFRAAFDLASPTSGSRADRVGLITERLAKNKKSRPARKKTLLSQINAYFGKSLPESEVEQIVKELVSNKVIEVTSRGSVVYKV